MRHLRLSALSEREKGYVVGFFIGDGNLFISKRRGVYRVRFLLGVNEKQVQAKLREILSKLLGSFREYTDRSTTLCFEVHSKEFVNYLKKTAAKDGSGINEDLCDLEFLRGLVEGLVDSDGNVKRNYAEITTANEHLKEKILRVLNRLGIKTNLRTFSYSTRRGRKVAYRVGFSLNNALFYPAKWEASAAQTAG